MLDIKRLRYLEAIYKYKNFTKASEELFVSQPAISSAVSTLEKELDVKLIKRNTREVFFTHEDEELMLRVIPILRSLEETEQIMEDYSQSKKQNLRLGLSPTLSRKFNLTVYNEFFPKWPDANIYVNEAPAGKHIEELLEETIDVAFNGIPDDMDYSSIDAVPLMQSEVMCMMAKNHPMAKYESIPIELLDGQRVCMLGTQFIIMKAIRSEEYVKGIAPIIMAVHEQIICMLDMIKYGGCVGFINELPGSTKPSYYESSLCIRPFSEPILITGGLLTKKGKRLPKIVRDFMEFTKETRNIWNVSNE